MFTVSIIGIGNRGGIYAKYLSENKDVKIVAGCDISKENLMSLNILYGVDKNNLFTDEEEFFKKKRSDVLVIATMDDLHTSHAIKALELGYDILLEKPIAPTYEQIKLIKENADKYNRNVVICHNLRYTPFYQQIKILIQNGDIGDVLSFEQSENVAYFHFAQSFVRGNWRDSKKTSPIILQKCCHDLDIIYWIIGKPCEKISSIGSLNFYNKYNAPLGATKKCCDCKVKGCNYNAIDIYCNYPDMLIVPFGFEKTKENIIKYLSSDDNLYGRCIYHCDNDVCDRQVVNMKFKNGITANLLMQGFASACTNRITRIYGTKGSINGDFNKGLIKIEKNNGIKYEIDINKDIKTMSHNGGDYKLIKDYVDYKNGGERPLGISLLSDSVYSHKLCFLAEQSRIDDGKEIEL